MIRTFASVVILGLATGAALADDKAADLVKRIESIRPPVFDRSKANDRKAIDEYLQSMRKSQAERADLIGELLAVDPKNDKLETLLPMRWQSLMQGSPDGRAKVAKEVRELKKTGATDKIKQEAAYHVALMGIYEDDPNALAEVDAYAKANPKDVRVAGLLYNLTYSIQDESKITEILRTILEKYPTSPTARQAKNQLAQAERVGKPFELTFQEATSGKAITMADLKGKVVVVDFWATWCGPCIAEMPKMKKLYAEFKDKGVEFIGISLDQPKDKGGLDKLLAYVKDNDVQWPQYYQGNYWQSEFSASWNVNSIPCVFIIDADGKLYSTRARGRLEKLIPELIAKRDNRKA